MSHSFPSLLQPSAEVEVECGVKHIARRQHRPLGFLSIPHSSLSVTKHHMFGLEYFLHPLCVAWKKILIMEGENS